MIREPILCGHCGGGVDESSPHCPWCGVPLKTVQVGVNINTYKPKDFLNPVSFKAVDTSAPMLTLAEARKELGLVQPFFEFDKANVREPGVYEIQCWPRGNEKPHYIAKLMNEPASKWQLLSTVGVDNSPSPEFMEMRKRTLDMRIILDNRDAKWPARPTDTTFDERVKQIKDAINSLGDHVMVRNWNDIQQALTPDMSTEATGIGAITHREYYYRNKMLRDVCDVLRKKERVMLFVNCSEEYIHTMTRMNAGKAWHVPIPEFMRHLFTVDESRLI